MVKVCYSGHQKYYEVIGEVVGYSTGVEDFSERNTTGDRGRDKRFQVPVLLIKNEHGIENCSLQKEYYTVTVKNINQEEE